jgi:hypothetical protein
MKLKEIRNLFEDQQAEGTAGAIAGGLAGVALTKSPRGAMIGAEIGSKLQDKVTEARTITLNGKPINSRSIEIDGVDRSDHPDYADAYISYAEYADGTKLSDDELEQLTNENGDLINELAHDSMHGAADDAYDRWKDSQYESTANEAEEPVTMTKEPGKPKSVVKVGERQVEFDDDAEAKRFMDLAKLGGIKVEQVTVTKEPAQPQSVVKTDDGQQIKFSNDNDAQQFAQKVKQGQAQVTVQEDDAVNPVASAVTRRIMNSHTDLLLTYGPEAVADAIDDVAEFAGIGPDDEIGTSDVSGWVNQVISLLKRSAPKESLDDLSELEEGWKEKLAAAGLAGAMAFGAAGGAQARVTPDQDPGVNRLTGQPNITQVAPAQSHGDTVRQNFMQNKDLQAADVVKRDGQNITVTFDGKDYEAKQVPVNAPTPRTGIKIKVHQAQMGIRGIGNYTTYLLPNGVAYIYSLPSTASESISESAVSEKAVSKQQQKFFGMAHAMQKGEKIKGASPELKKVAQSMSKKDVKDFAQTKHKGLPTKVKEDIEKLFEEQSYVLHVDNAYDFDLDDERGIDRVLMSIFKDLGEKITIDPHDLDASKAVVTTDMNIDEVIDILDKNGIDAHVINAPSADQEPKESVESLAESVLDDADDSGFMAKSNLYVMIKDAIKLHEMISDRDNLEGWVEEKITLATDYIKTVRDYLEYNAVRGMEQPAAEQPAISLAVPAKPSLDVVKDDRNPIIDSKELDDILRLSSLK